MDAFALTDIGILRNMNQDAVFVQCTLIGSLNNLFVVADGMGGHQAGDFASAYAISRLQELVQKKTDKTPSELLEWAFQTINYELYEKGHTNEALFGMGTTLVACTLDDDLTMTVANVGDSRLYVYNQDRGLHQITKDHSYVEELVQRGQITRDSDLYKQSKNIITRAIGAGETVKTDIFQLELEPGDKVLLCSDGLTNMVPDSLIGFFLAISDSAENTARRLIHEANYAGGTDNISAIVVETVPIQDEEVTE